MSAPAPSPSSQSQSSSSTNTAAPSLDKRSSMIRPADPWHYLTQYKTDTHARMSGIASDATITEEVYTPEEQLAMKQLREEVAQMVQDEKLMKCTASDYPGGMHQHWTNYWPEGKDHPLFQDTISHLDRDSTTWPDHELIRFLRAREMNLKKAVKMYFYYRRWRIVYGVSHLASFPTMPFEPQIISILSHSYHQLDKHFRPIYLQRSGLIDPVRFTTEMTVERISIGHTWFSQEMRKRCELGSLLKGQRVNELVNIIDIQGLGIGARRMLPIFSTTSFIDQNFYPETLGSLFIINAPSFFPPIYSLCKSFLSTKTQAKVQILGSDYKTRLIEVCGPEGLPIEFGGTCDKCQAVGGCCPYATGPGTFVRPGEEDADEREIVLKAGALQRVEIPYVHAISYDGEDGEETQQEAWWSVEVQAKDVDFTVELRRSIQKEESTSRSRSTNEGATSSSSAAAAAPSSQHHHSAPRILHPTTRLLSSVPPHIGTYSGTESGLITLIFDNSYSRWNSKTVKVKTGARPIRGAGAGKATTTAVASSSATAAPTTAASASSSEETTSAPEETNGTN